MALENEQSPSHARGALIVFEGGDRSGKSTQCQLLIERLITAGHEVKNWRFPDRSSITGQMIDQYLKGSTDLDPHVAHLLFSANRWEAMAELTSLLHAGTIIIMDRYAYSGLAYSVTKGLDWYWCRNADAGLLRPDLVIYMDIDPIVASQRGEYGKERFEQVDFQAQLRAHFMAMGKESKCPWKVLDANQPRDALSNQIFDLTQSTLSEASQQPLSNALWL